VPKTLHADSNASASSCRGRRRLRARGLRADQGPAAGAHLAVAAVRAQELYYLVNNERAANGLGPVGWHDQLGGLAQNWSNRMAGSGNYSHQNLDAILQDPAYGGFNGLGENISAAAAGSPRDRCTRRG
jgi:uncharacterized protein YkwD